VKAVAFSNNDIAVVAWTFGGRIPGCLGFAVYRTDVKAGTETCLPALATFPGQDAVAGRVNSDDPVCGEVMPPRQHACRKIAVAPVLGGLHHIYGAAA
jgi:hypothetical protein